MKKAITYLHLVFTTFLVLNIAAFSYGQETNTIPRYIKSDLTLESGVYTVVGTHYVAKDVTLTVKPGASLLFEPDAVIRVDGGLDIAGEPKNLINITSKNTEKPGNGFVINGIATDKSINMEYARFNHLKKPLAFEFRWSRKAVNVESNVFKNSKYEGAAIQVRDIDKLLTLNVIPFNFKDNTFSNSTSSLLFSDVSSDLLLVDFDNNVVTRNEYTGRMRNGIFTSPVYMTYNEYQRNSIPTLDNNSIFDNFYTLFYDDTSNIGRTNISVIGNADELDLSGNYFGDPANGEIQTTFDFISANYQAPFLYANTNLPTPPNYLNGHFYEIFMNGDQLNEEILFTKYTKPINNIELRFNRPVEGGTNYGVFYHFVDESGSVKSTPIKSSLKWSEGNQFVRININENLKDYGLIGYLEIDGFYDSDGMDVPTLYIGKKALIEPKLRNYIPLNSLPYIPIKDGVTYGPDDSLVVMNPTKNIVVEGSPISDSFVHLKSKFWDLGFFVGNSIYFGDMNRTVLSVNPGRMTPAGGIRTGYQFSERFKISATNNYMIIRGSDRPLDPNSTNPRGTNFERNLSVRTTIIDAGLQFEYAFWKYKLKSTYIPVVFGGANIYYFQPKAQINPTSGVQPTGEWYDLRKIGTGGQTLPGGPGEYEKFSYGIPMGFAIKRHLTQRLVAQASYTYNKVFTDYLDDLSTDTYADPVLLQNANSDLPPGVAAALSNPGNQPTRFQRSLSDDNDGYGYWGLTFTWKL